MKQNISELEIYLVGGAVRDYVIGIGSNDNDYVVIGSTPEEMLSLGFTQVGADFPVFLHPVTKEEYALARRERKTGSGYLGFECDFGTDVTLEEDLSRRDFRANSMAMALDGIGRIIDPFNGQQDIKNRTLSITSNAFGEDPLRVLRAARFCARYGWEMNSDDVDICRSIVASGALNELPTERFWKEIEKMYNDGYGLHKFIAHMRHFNAYRHCNFFKQALPAGGLYSRYNYLEHNRHNFDFECISIVYADEEEPTTIFPSKMAERLYELNKIFIDFCLDRSSDNVYRFLSHGGAFREGSICHKVLSFNGIMGNHNIVEVNLLRVAEKLCQTVKSTDFPDVAGKELGDAIKNKRMELISCIFYLN